MSKPRVLVTGASGFTGHYVCKELQKREFEVFSLTQDGTINGKSVDLCSYNDVLKCIKQVQPESVIHLAAIAFVGHESPNDFYRVNIEGTLNLLRALEVVNCIKGTVILSSSANIYGNAYQDQAICEYLTPQPINDYAVSKLSMEYMARLHMDRLPIIIVRPFNYTGLRQNESFLIPKIVNAFKNKQKTIELGNINISRDYSDVRDIAAYYVSLVILKLRSQTLNFCSGKTVSLLEIIEICQKITGHTIEIKSVPELQRKNELRSLCGDRARLQAVLGVFSNYNIEQTLRWMLADENKS